MQNQSPQHKSVIAEKCRAAARPAMIQVAPGKYAPDPAAENVPEMSIGRFVPDGRDASGRETFRFVPVMENMVRVNAKVLAKIGMAGQWDTLQRLGIAGFIELVRVAPHTTLLNLDSWYGHVARCAEDPDDFWNEKRTKEYRKAI